MAEAIADVHARNRRCRDDSRHCARDGGFGAQEISLFIILLPAGIPWLVQAFTPYLSLLYLGRVVSCFIYIALGPVTAVLVAEISEPRIRGLLLSAEEITVAIAQMAIYIMAHSLPWDVATAACAAPMILVAALTFFVPESPYWLIRRGQKDAALESLKKLRSPKQDVNLELQEISANVQGTSQPSIWDQIRQPARPQNYRPVLLAAVFTLRELGGQFVMFSYTVYMFQKAGVGLDAFVCNPSGRREARLHSGQRGGRGPRRASASADRHVFRVRSSRGCRRGVPAGGRPRVVVGPACCGDGFRVLVRPWNRTHSLDSYGRAHSHSCEKYWKFAVLFEFLIIHLCHQFCLPIFDGNRSWLCTPGLLFSECHLNTIALGLLTRNPWKISE
ncbi:hypothetical protein C7M84_003927 [Penaeus vannamei]|uniref:Facilitated trehalose transporter Tret1 n=1 Tax=Penaeus vannamei TaxID=6689 RepID=A0A423TLT3_PENVA|nr:hypothetical protein C7M84_003927 [Penaeus vannamei]